MQDMNLINKEKLTLFWFHIFNENNEIYIYRQNDAKYFKAPMQLNYLIWVLGY
jgi:hypothetical protein